MNGVTKTPNAANAKFSDLAALFEKSEFIALERLARAYLTKALANKNAATRTANDDEKIALYWLAQAVGHQKTPAKFDEAIGLMEKLLAADPLNAAYHNDYGALFAAHAAWDKAEAAYKMAMIIDPSHNDAAFNLALARFHQGALDEALATLATLEKKAPDFAETAVLRGEILQAMRHFSDAESAFVTGMQKGALDAETKLSLLLLLQGRYEEGWARYEQRVHLPQMANDRPRFTQPEWQGEPLEGKTLLVYVEQGFGDNIQFVRYFPLLRAAHPSATLYYWTRKPLLRLLEASSALHGVQLLPDSLPHGLPAFDYQIALLSLPQRFGTRAETIPAAIPYLQASEALINSWGEKIAARLGGSKNKRIGLVWRGSDTHLYNDLRSITFAKLAPLVEIPGIDWICLQQDASANVREKNADAPPLVNVMAEVTDFADTAAIIAHCDLVIGVDTAVIHLAAAMGKPVFLLNRFDTDWRWLIGINDSPWYPTLRLFQQTAFGDWDAPIDEVHQALCAMMAQLSAPSADS